MALQEHPYYGSFGYQVANFFAVSSRFGTPDEFKQLVDEAHGYGIAVIMDVVHSHAVSNEVEGLSKFDGSEDLYFHPGERGKHPAWDSRCFDYGKDAVIHFLLSNLKFWMEEYHLDGFRFDGVTSMLYYDHGLGRDFCSYDAYYDGGQDVDALVYLGLANILVKELRSDAFTIAEEMSGMPGLAAPISQCGWGFDYRMSMGVPDNWIKWIKDVREEDWSMGGMYYELTNKRRDEKTISYVECHDQAMVGDKTVIFRLIDKEMYFSMDKASKNPIVERGIALHKMIRLVTVATAGDGYLTFMGNEFGHPEWIDFPREGNNWSHKHARRQWSLKDDPELRFKALVDFDRDMIHLIKGGNVLRQAPMQLYVSDSEKVLIFARGRFIFALNFNSVHSFSDFEFCAPSGEYRVALSSDAEAYDGFGRIDESVHHHTIRKDGGDKLSLYLPSRSAMVLEKIR
jgi:1,4-alpha-glucan branching enzyme